MKNFALVQMLHNVSAQQTLTFWDNDVQGHVWVVPGMFLMILDHSIDPSLENIRKTVQSCSEDLATSTVSVKPSSSEANTTSSCCVGLSYKIVSWCPTTLAVLCAVISPQEVTAQLNVRFLVHLSLVVLNKSIS